MSEAKIKLRVDGAGDAKAEIKSVAGAFDMLGQNAKGALIGIATGLSAGSFSSWVKGAIDAADNLNDLSKSTAISVEQLAGLEAAAKKSGGELDSVASSINKLSVNMGKDAEKFSKLGITAKEPLEAFKQLADVYKSIEDPQRRAAFAADALGKSWEGAAPLLNEGGKAIGEMVEKGTRLSGVTQKLADDSDKFNDSLVDLSTAATGLKMKIASDLLPGMTSFLETVTFAYQETGKLETAWVALGGLGALVFTDEFDSDTKKLQNLRQEITDFKNEQIAREKTYGVDGVLTRFLFGGYSAEGLAQQITYLTYEAEQLAKKIAIDSAPKPKEPSKPPIGGGKCGTGSDGENEAARLIKTRASFVAALDKELQTIGKTAEQNKIYEATLLGIKGRQLDLVKVKVADLALQKERIEEEKRWETIAKKNSDEQLKYMQGMDASLDSLKSQVDAQREYNDSLGLSKDALVEIGAVKLEDLAIGKEKNAQMLEEIGLETEQIEILRQQAAELRTLAQLKRDGFKKEEAIEYSADLAAQSKRDFEKMQDESQKFTDSLYDGLSDSLYRGFESGKGFFQSFWDGIKNLFKTTVLKLAVQGVMTGVLGMGASGYANAQGGVGSAANMAAQGSSLWQGFSAAGSAASGAQSLFSTALASAGSAFGSAALTSAGYASGVAGLSSFGAGSQAAMLAAQTAEFGAAGLSATTAAGSTAAGAGGIGAGISSALAAIPVWGWAALAAAAVATKFGGGKDRVLGDQSISGDLGSSNISRNVSWTKDGGWFHGDTSGTWNYNLANSTAIASNGQAYQDTANISSDQALLTQLNDAYTGMKSATTDYAKTLGINADAIANRSDSINFALGKSQEESAANVQKALGSIADDMAKTILASFDGVSKAGESASQTLTRVATNIGSVNAAFDVVGLKLFDLNSAGLKAASAFADAFGGLENLQTVSTSYYENFFNQEEKTANALKLVGAEFDKLSLGTLPNTRAEYRKLVEDISKTGNAEQLAGLLKLSGAFATVIPEIDQTNDALSRFTSATDAAASPLVRVTSALDATGEAAQKAAAILSERGNLQSQIDAATMTSTQLLEKQRNALDESNRAKFDELQVSLTTKQSADALEQANAAIQGQIDVLINAGLTTGELRAKELVGLGQSTAALKKRLFALQDESKMTEQLKAQSIARSDSFNAMMNSMVDGIAATAKSFEKLAETMKKARDSLIVGDNSGFDLKDRLAIMREQLASASDAELPGLSNEYLSLLKNSGVGGVDYQREFASIVNRYTDKADSAQLKSVPDYSGVASFGEALAKQNAIAEIHDIFSAEYRTYAEQIQDVRSSDSSYQINLQRGNKFVELDQSIKNSDIETSKALLEEIKRLRQASEATAAMLSSGVLLVEVAA